MSTGAYRALGEAAWSWVRGQVREDEGPWLPVSVAVEAPQREPAGDRDSLYAGIAGLAPLLAEIGLYRPLREEEHALAGRVLARLTNMTRTRAEPSLFDGLAGDVTALRLLSPGAEQTAMRRLTDLMTPTGTGAGAVNVLYGSPRALRARGSKFWSRTPQALKEPASTTTRTATSAAMASATYWRSATSDGPATTTSRWASRSRARTTPCTAAR